MKHFYSMYFLFDYYFYTLLSGRSQLNFFVENLIQDGIFLAVVTYFLPPQFPYMKAYCCCQTFFQIQRVENNFVFLSVYARRVVE